MTVRRFRFYAVAPTFAALLFATAPHTNAQGISEALRQMMLDEVAENGDTGNDYEAYRSECSKRICTYSEPLYTGPVEYMTPYGEWTVYHYRPVRIHPQSELNQ